MEAIKGLYRADLVLKSEARTQSEVFQDIGAYLLKKNIVTEGFTQAICERERKYPTGLDLSVLADSLPNVAIPHTDAKYCKTKVIVFVKLKQVISFNHMIKPDEPLAVRYLFFIINNSNEKQSTTLSELMEFIMNSENLKKLEKLDTEKDIYEYLIYKQRIDSND